MSSDESECPLCLEPMDSGDASFYPCPCLYQVCRFCWAKILNEENGLCPACRQPYDSEAPAAFAPQASFENKRKPTKRKKEIQHKPTMSKETYKLLPELRVIQTNLVFVVGLPQWISKDKEVLKGPQYFGQFGKVFKVEVNTNQTFTGPQGQPSISAYITYCRPEDAMRAVLALDQSNMHGRQLRVSLGTTKYCSQFLRGHKCNKHECMYLHDLGDPKASFTKEQMQAGKHTEYMNALLESFLQSLSSSSSSVPAANTAPGKIMGENEPSLASSSCDSTSSSVATIVTAAATALGDKPSISSSSLSSCSQQCNLGDSASAVKLLGGQPEHIHTKHKTEIPSSSSSIFLPQKRYPRSDGSMHLFSASMPEHNENANVTAAGTAPFLEQQQQNSFFPSQPASPSSNFKFTETADIDFDPIRESQQGLAELMAIEMIFPTAKKKFNQQEPSQNISLSTQTPVSFAPPPGFEDSSVNVGENVALFSSLVEELHTGLLPSVLPEFINSQFPFNPFSGGQFDGRDPSLQDLLTYQRILQSPSNRSQQLQNRQWGTSGFGQPHPVNELFAASILNHPTSNCGPHFSETDSEKLSELLMSASSLEMQPSSLLNGFSSSCLVGQSDLPSSYHSVPPTKAQNPTSSRMDPNEMWLSSEMNRTRLHREEGFSLSSPPPASSTSSSSTYRRNFLLDNSQSAAAASFTNPHSQRSEFNRHKQVAPVMSGARLSSDNQHHLA